MSKWVIFDMDSTIANISTRKKLATKSGADWIVTGTIVEAYTDHNELKFKLQEVLF